MNLLIIIAIMIIPLWAQARVSSNYSKYSKIDIDDKVTGNEVALAILKKNGLDNVYVVETPGKLSDHYDPSRKVVRLSKDVFHGTSIASVAVAAHEVGHAIQDKEGYAYMKFRSVIFPVVRFSTSIAPILILISFLFSSSDFLYGAIALMSVELLFQIVTLPVEFDASAKAKKELKETTFVNSAEQDGVEKMLDAAAMTYVAGVLASFLEVFRLLLIARNNE